MRTILFALAACSLSLAANPESWTDLSINGAHLTAAPPVVGQVDREPVFTRELIELNWRAGDPIHIYVIRPAAAVLNPPVVISIHNYDFDTHAYLDDGFCKSLVKSGVAVVELPSALSLDRFHDRPMAQWFVSELQESLAESVHDVEFLLEYLRTRTDLDGASIGIYGEGSGGAIAVLAASADARIHVLDLVNPWGDWPDWLAASPTVPDDERPRYLQPQFLRSVSSLDPVSYLPKLALPIRVQIGKTVVDLKIKSALPKSTVFTSNSSMDWISTALHSQAKSTSNIDTAVTLHK